jgi:hypothetical protein
MFAQMITGSQSSKEGVLDVPALQAVVCLLKALAAFSPYACNLFLH